MKQAIRNAVSRVLNIGVPIEMSPEEAKYVQMGNLGSLLMIAVNIPYMILCLANGWVSMFVELCVVNTLLLVTTLINQTGRHMLAIVYFGTLLNLHLVFVTVAMGRATLLPLLIFFTAGGAITLVRRGETKLIVFALVAILVMYEVALGLEGAYGPIYQLTSRQLSGLRTLVEYSFFGLIIVNAVIGRVGAIAAEDRLRAEQKRSEGLLERLREEDRRKTQFFQNVSHELRTPLTLILGPLEGLLTGGDGPLLIEQRRQLEIMNRNARRLLRLINQLLDLSKIDVGKMSAAPRHGNLAAFVTDLVQSFAAYAERRRIALAVHADGAGTAVMFDSEIVEKVLSNLLSNACKFTPAGGQVDVRLAETPARDEISISVKDTGIGIPPGEVQHIFDRFHQVDGSTTRSHEGTGIGLSLVKELIQIHSGRIEVRSMPNHGTEFVVTLPRSLHAAEPSRPTPLATPPDFAYAQLKSTGLESLLLDTDESANGSLRDDRPLVLVVEDNRDMRGFIRRGIEAHCRVIEAADGEEGLAKAREHRPRLIISDVMMPKMDGHDLCRAIRADEHLNTVPVMLLTAKASRETIVEGLEAGAIDCITKPFSFDVLLAKIRGVLQRKAEQEELALRDRLTGLLNRAAWQHAADCELADLERHGSVASIVFLDLDDFKRVNDTYGHAVGDQVLVELARTLVCELRFADHVGRYGGEEFVLYLPDSSGENAVRSIQRILTTFRQTAIGTQNLHCAFSAGVVEIGPGQSGELSDLVARADAAMYRAKREGKGRVVLGDSHTAVN